MKLYVIGYISYKNAIIVSECDIEKETGKMIYLVSSDNVVHKKQHRKTDLDLLGRYNIITLDESKIDKYKQEIKNMLIADYNRKIDNLKMTLGKIINL